MKRKKFRLTGEPATLKDLIRAFKWTKKEKIESLKMQLRTEKRKLEKEFGIKCGTIKI